MAEITREVKEVLGTLSVSKAGWPKDLRLVSWNGAAPKYDIRSWSPDDEKTSAGLTFTKEEMSALKKLLNEMPDL